MNNNAEYWEEEAVSQKEDMKKKIDLFIQMAKQSNQVGVERTRKLVSESEKKRLEMDVEELLAEEQRSTVMGTWA